MKMTIQEIRLKKAEILTKLIEVTDLNDVAINQIVSYVFKLCNVPEEDTKPNNIPEVAAAKESLNNIEISKDKEPDKIDEYDPPIIV